MKTASEMQALNKTAGKLASLIRRGVATSEQTAEYHRIESEVAAYRASQPREPVRGLYDLPIFGRMWKADALALRS